MTDFKIPKTFGACADRLYELKEKRRAAQAVVDELAAEETAIKEHVIATMSKEDTGAMGRRARIAVVTKDIPQVKDYDAFYSFLRKSKRFDLLQRRLNLPAVAELLENKVTVPGVEIYRAVTVSLNKL